MDKQKLHDIDLGDPEDQHPQVKRARRGSSITGPVNYARPRPFHIPRHASQSFPDFKAKQECALRLAIRHLERTITRHTGIAHLTMTNHTLTLHPSQSKLSQQELSDLQKATHFDKKELQQWYKGDRPTALHFPPVVRH